MTLRPLLPVLLLLALLGMPYALNQGPANITYNSSDPCPSWTAWAPTKIVDVQLTDLGYVRNCQNITYVSFCVIEGSFFTTGTYVNYSQARHYTSIDCSTKDYCQGWTRFYPETYKNLTSRTPDNMTRTCVNTTFVSWCIRQYSNIDYRTGRRYSEINCTTWGPACAFLASEPVATVQRDTSYCRPCNVTAIRNECNYGGKISSTPVASQSVCGTWSLCPGASAYPTTPAAPASSFMVTLDNSNMFIAVLMGIGLTVLLVVVMVFSHRSD